MKPIKEAEWFKRQFNFDLPVEFFSCLDREGARHSGEAGRVGALLSPEILTTRIGEAGERWSIQELVGHLHDLDELHEGRLEDYKAGAEVLRAADLTNKKTYEADHNSKPITKLLADFREARMGFVRRLEEMDEEAASASAMHPRLGKPMRVIDLAYFVAEHDDHHLAEITYAARTLRS